MINHSQNTISLVLNEKEIKISDGKEALQRLEQGNANNGSYKVTYRNWGGRRISAGVGQPPWRGKPECSCFLPLNTPKLKHSPHSTYLQLVASTRQPALIIPQLPPLKKYKNTQGFEILFALARIIFIDGNMFFFLFHSRLNLSFLLQKNTAQTLRFILSAQ